MQKTAGQLWQRQFRWWLLVVTVTGCLAGCGNSEEVADLKAELSKAQSENADLRKEVAAAKAEVRDQRRQLDLLEDAFDQVCRTVGYPTRKAKEVAGLIREMRDDLFKYGGAFYTRTFRETLVTMSGALKKK